MSEKNNSKHSNFIPKLCTYLVINMNLETSNPYLPNEKNKFIYIYIYIYIYITNTLLISFLCMSLC